ncbi:DUF6286 domain-containing protein [Amycolatopsis sp. H20-H5]|uniref:DUF6286 domain-containing protein n=1 Tax=Amycolatopsis sp. H20-H5 TaxID=3046309 RepID=UPI002DB81138|nr:DUF6286 domain-containing protein [Amycolatopsis sp. H20-H5]MEC3981090.1 DUF6286 domain-containing protein [Amycolatopsis sp. H20-H5]
MRVFVRLLSVLLALAVAGAGVLLAIEVGWHWWRPASGPLLVPWPSWRATLGAVGWDSFAVRLVAAVAAVAGLVLMLLALSASRRTVRLHDPATEVSFTTTPRSLARLVGIAVRAQDNVRSASVTASAKRVRVRATSRRETEAELRPRLLETVSALLDDVPLARKPKVSVVVDSPQDRK